MPVRPHASRPEHQAGRGERPAAARQPRRRTGLPVQVHGERPVSVGTRSARGPAAALRTAAPLPSPMREMQDGGVQIEAAVPDDLELLPPAEATAPDPHHFSWRFGQTPEEVPLSWQPYTPEVRVSSVIDLTFSGRRAQVQHELHLHFARTAGTQITLKTPPALGASLQVVGSGGALIDDPAPAAGTRVPQAARRRAGTGGHAPVFLPRDGTVRGRALLGRGAGEGRRREGAGLVRSGPAAAAAGRRLVGAEYRRDRQAAPARAGAGERPTGRAADVGLQRSDGRAVGAGGPGASTAPGSTTARGKSTFPISCANPPRTTWKSSCRTPLP